MIQPNTLLSIQLENQELKAEVPKLQKENIFFQILATHIVAVTAYALGKGGQDWKFCRINHFHIHKYKWILVLNFSIHERNMQLKCYSCEDHFVYQEPEEIKTIWMYYLWYQFNAVFSIQNFLKVPKLQFMIEIGNTNVSLVKSKSMKK